MILENTFPDTIKPNLGKKGIGDRILKAGIAVLIAHVCFKLFGVIQGNIIPNYFGEVVSDVFIFVYSIVLQTAFNIGEQCMAPAMLPIFARAKEKEGEARAWRYVSVVFTCQFLLLVILSGCLIFSADFITRWGTRWEVQITLNTQNGIVKGELTQLDETGYTVAMGGQERHVAFSEVLDTVLTLDVEKGRDERIGTKDDLQKEVEPDVKMGPVKKLDYDKPKEKNDTDRYEVASEKTLLTQIPDVSKLRDELKGKQERSQKAVGMLPYIALALIGMSLASLTYVMLNAYKEFFWAAFGDSIFKLCVLSGAVLGAVISRQQAGTYADWRYLALGAVAGGTLKLITHLFALRWQRIRLYRPSLNLTDPYFKEFLILALPLLAGIFVSTLRDGVINNVLTSHELLPTYFKQGKSVIDTLSFLVPYTLSIALLPYFCDLSVQGDHVQLGAILTRTLRMLFWFFVPLGVLLAMAAGPLCFILYSGKVIDAEKVIFSTLVLQCFCLQLPFAALEIMVMQAYFSNRRMLTPMLAGFLFSGLAAGVAYAVVVQGKMESPMSILLTVSLCLVSSKILKSILLVGILRSSVPLLPAKETLFYLAKLTLAGVGAGAAAWAGGWIWRVPLESISQHLSSERLIKIGECAAVGLSGLAVYLLLSIVILRMNEPSECWYWTREKLKRKGQKTTPKPEE